MRTRILLFLIPMLAVAAYRLHHTSPSDRDAAALIDRSFAPSWSSNEQWISSMEERVRRDPDDVKAAAMLGQAYLQRVRESGDPANYKKADVLFERALKKDPKSIDAMLGKATLLMARHQFAQARDFARTAIEIEPDVVATYGVLTDALVELGEIDEAIEVLGTMVRRKPNLSSYSRVSYIRELKGDVPGAIEAMTMAVESGAPTAENTAWCMVHLGNLYLHQEQLDRAEAQYRRALRQFPEYGHAFGGLAKVAAAKQDFAAAAEHYRRAIDRVPLSEFALGLGTAYQELGMMEESLVQFNLARSLEERHRDYGVAAEGARK